MKKLFTTILFVLSIICGLSAHAEDGGIKISLDGEPLNTAEWTIQPFIQDGRIMVPVREFGQAVGYEVGWSVERKDITLKEFNWSAEFKYVTLKKDEYWIELTIDSKGLKIGMNGHYSIDAAPYILNGKTVVPLRNVAEALNMTVDWNPENREAAVTTVLPGTDSPYSDEWAQKVGHMMWCINSIFELRNHSNGPENQVELANKFVFDLYSLRDGETISYKPFENEECLVSLNTDGHYACITISKDGYFDFLAEQVAMRILLGYDDYIDYKKATSYHPDSSENDPDSSENDTEAYPVITTCETENYIFTITAFQDKYETIVDKKASGN